MHRQSPREQFVQQQSMQAQSRPAASWRTFWIACLGVVFSAIGVWVFVLPIVTDLRAGRVVVMTTIKTRVTWSHDYTFDEHPVYFALKILTDALGAVAFAGTGLLLLYFAVRIIFDPTGATMSSRVKLAGSVWAFTCLGSFFLFGLLHVFPYLLKYGILT
jgi:hypothetical protein